MNSIQQTQPQLNGTSSSTTTKMLTNSSTTAATTATTNGNLNGNSNSRLDEQRRLLIEEVRKRPWIYYKKDPAYNERVRIQQSWKEISELIGWEEEMCKSKWRNVRDAYRKIQRSHQKNPNDSSYINRHPELAFLDDCPFKPRKQNHRHRHPQQR
ncbi:hypothetical protein BLA29_001050 [Euroglyphus maynei]|uniref:MADF domain-containing protein n=1 Tax=Euroglyphus maynei TaxID=6958 RepID=A0A1Y3B3H2_EURMA|nr:hypothetical protein BLA29_001050 [Euroglyphus maynei]